MGPTDILFGGRYRIVGEVGRGGMGVIYRGVDTTLDREVAIKVMSTDFAESGDEAKARFLREAKAAAKLQHRNIVTVFEFSEQDGVSYIVMEFLKGQSLATRLAAGSPMPLEQKLDVMTELCNGLQFAHENGVIHRDVKPANVWILDDGAVKLVDFGIAKITSSMMTMRGDIMGSAAYMSPEQVEGHSVTGRSDVFSTAVVLYEMVARKRPFEGDSPTSTMMQIVHVDPPSLDSLVPGLPKELVEAIRRGLAKNPDDRFQSAGEFGAELQLIRMALPRSEETVFASPPPPPPPPPPAPTHPHTLPLKAEPLPLRAPAATPQPTRGAGTLTVPRHVLIGAAAAVLVAVAGYAVFGGTPKAPAPAAPPPVETQRPQPAPSTRGFRIQSSPGADVLLNGTKKGVTSASLQVKPGDRIKLQRKGSESKELTLTEADIARGSGEYMLVDSVKPEAPRASVRMFITGSYEFEVRDEGRTVSQPSRTHEFSTQEGRRLTLYSEQYFLTWSVTAKRGRDGTGHEQAPELGQIELVGYGNDSCQVYNGGRPLNRTLRQKLPPMGPGRHHLTFKCADRTVLRDQFVPLKAGEVDKEVVIIR